MLSDIRFAESFVLNRVERGAGPVRIRAELTVRGVDNEIIDSSMAEYASSWNELAAEVYRKRYRGEPVADFEEKARRANFLQGRGFSSEQVRYALEHCDDEELS
jgi:regulatory protein